MMTRTLASAAGIIMMINDISVCCFGAWLSIFSNMTSYINSCIFGNLSLLQPMTDGNELLRNPLDLIKYYYGISQVSIQAR